MKALVSEAADPQRTPPPILHRARLRGNSFRKNPASHGGCRPARFGSVRAVGLELRFPASGPASPDPEK
jgi:hypothetical protein